MRGHVGGGLARSSTIDLCAFSAISHARETEASPLTWASGLDAQAQRGDCCSRADESTWASVFSVEGLMVHVSALHAQK